MPLILTQHASRDLNQYLDRENLVYHFPSQYYAIARSEIVENGNRQFLYQRPIRGAPAGQAGTYFGYGLLGDPYPDTRTPGHYFVDIYDPQSLRPVPLRDVYGFYYETGRAETLMLRGRSVRRITMERYHNILAAGLAYSAMPEQAVINVQDAGVYAPAAAPKDAFRDMVIVPPGTGYVPRGNGMPDPYEAAALHERARADHQETLRLIVEAVRKRGGACLYNNNVDLVAKIGERRLLVEAKSLSRQSVAVDRMRYGMGQLMDYGVRYRAELQGAEPVLAFGARPERDVGWIPEILEGNGIAFISNASGALVAGNVLGECLPLF
jgi:hypothetical protein